MSPRENACRMNGARDIRILSLKPALMYFLRVGFSTLLSPRRKIFSRPRQYHLRAASYHRPQPRKFLGERRASLPGVASSLDRMTRRPAAITSAIRTTPLSTFLGHGERDRRGEGVGSRRVRARTKERRGAARGGGEKRAVGKRGGRGGRLAE